MFRGQEYERLRDEASDNLSPGEGRLGALMSNDRREERPLWVKVGLWGLPNRASAWMFVWLSLALAVACVAYGLVDGRFFLGGILVFAALWYYASIRWVDQYGQWS